jgi:hypothetical protein
MRNETGQLLAFAFLSVIPSEGNLLLPLPLPLLLSLLFLPVIPNGHLLLLFQTSPRMVSQRAHWPERVN